MNERNLSDVIAQMIKLIPADRDALVQRLQAVDRKVPYCPPESSGTLWRLCCAVLVEEIGLPPLGRNHRPITNTRKVI